METEELSKKWDIHRVVQEAVKTAHLEPAPETKERLSCLEIKQENLMDKLNEFQSDNKEAHEGILKAVEKLEIKLDEALEQKAGVWVEKVLIFAGSAIGLGLITYLGTLIYETAIHLTK